MKLSPQISLCFNGECQAAFRLYARCLSGTVAFMLTWGDSPAAAEAPPGWEGKLYHATLRIGEAEISGSDVPPDRYLRPQGFSVVLQMDDIATAERAFHALAEQGRIDWPLQETFWASRFGVVVDRFGIPWSINCEKAISHTS